METEQGVIVITNLPPMRFEEGQLVSEFMLIKCLYYNGKADDEKFEAPLYYRNSPLAWRSVRCRAAGIKLKVNYKWFINEEASPYREVTIRPPWEHFPTLASLEALFVAQVGVSPKAELKTISTLKVKSSFWFPTPKMMTARQYWDAWDLVENNKYGSTTKTVPGVDDVLFARAHRHKRIPPSEWHYLTKDWRRCTLRTTT